MCNVDNTAFIHTPCALKSRFVKQSQSSWEKTRLSCTDRAARSIWHNKWMGHKNMTEKTDDLLVFYIYYFPSYCYLNILNLSIPPAFLLT